MRYGCFGASGRDSAAHAAALEPGRVKQLERENHKRERSIARAAERAGGGELGLLAVDGNARALREARRVLFQ